MGLLISDQTFDKFFEADYQAKQEAQLYRRETARQLRTSFSARSTLIMH